MKSIVQLIAILQVLSLFFIPNSFGQNSYSQPILKSDFRFRGNNKSNSDSLTIRALIDQSDQHRYGGEYDIAFDKLWESLLLAKKYDFTNELVEIYRDIGILYDIYNKDSLSLNYLNKALSLSKERALTDNTINGQIISNYFSIATFWRDRANYELALKYLDSCYMVYDDSRVLPYVLTDQGFCNLHIGNTSIAGKQLNIALNYLAKDSVPYVAVNLAFTGDLKKETYQYDSAIYYYKKSLEWIETNEVHRELKADILQSISETFTIKGDYRAAINYLKEAKSVNDKLFSITSQHNQRLFEIKNNYKAKIEANKLTIAEQQFLIEQKDKKLTSFIIALFVTIAIGILVYLFFQQRSRLKRLALLNKLKADKNEAIVEVKNKELATYALKVVKMEENIDNLSKILKAKDPIEYKAYKRESADLSAGTWNEFNKRFAEVNKSFYKLLCSKHPSLSPTELKHCALIKMNFNNYEMSKILNISLRSVHTSRYRIRKKMELDSNSHLTSYIGSL